MPKIMVISSRVRIQTQLYLCAQPILTQVGFHFCCQEAMGQGGGVQDPECGNGQKEDPRGPAKVRLSQCSPLAPSVAPHYIRR